MMTSQGNYISKLLSKTLSAMMLVMKVLIWKEMSAISTAEITQKSEGNEELQ